MRVIRSEGQTVRLMVAHFVGKYTNECAPAVTGPWTRIKTLTQASALKMLPLGSRQSLSGAGGTGYPPSPSLRQQAVHICGSISTFPWRRCNGRLTEPEEFLRAHFGALKIDPFGLFQFV